MSNTSVAPENHSSSALPASRQFNRESQTMTRDLRHRALIQKALGGYYVKRDEKKSAYASWPEARQAAAEIKWEAITI
jgi:hypothetical protein